ncbi:N-(5'-phosphoribosyl)anthranilate isomerase [Jannaschia pagri]|uniref:N-(5'-phosphoribosyl)anthranilate isomerase n=1 Tax=Jannaschia pagri TaxID=2829797 RepID=A0ABQ4NKJ0_9RHOB|nr:MULTISPECIES: phosphoribosylanthranilate isomerase [unclassified Jannaschia]GIT91077.1 N-(5'-phosphoribosyl)anthranilate isomerase [Jannaschia sp. AI_61]GIT94909.1 N-(5'-phosphoribosyl)anthranilate isomerase [Jannaschia sp. AI_62]
MLRVNRPGGGVRVKICGLRTLADVDATAKAGAAYMGLVFFPKSPRHVDIDLARTLAMAAPVGLAKVALLVNPDDETLDHVLDQVPLDMIQLHGSETPERLAEVRARSGLPVMKAVGIRTAEDLAQLDQFDGVADQVLVDAKPPAGSDRPGGNGVGFDWTLIADREWKGPWMLSGGLTPENLAQAIAQTGARQVDASSSLEVVKGVKDAAKIAAFCAAA